ncbi:MAG TPA: IPT/TIG domain-containing protein [Rariglobus sp.]|jgi:hypothetical protein|nr:IPT/TIG domain-containing protein [Rariglobus sp.]
MQNNRFSHARRIFLTISAALSLFLLSGCGVSITNLTPTVIPANPSQIYTISARVNPKAANIIPGSLVVRIFIDGQSFAMTKSDLGTDIYTFDYELPAGRDEIAYYFLVNYKFETNGITSSREEFIDVVHTKIVGRYVLSLESNRGPVGARVSVLGRGFTAQDTVTFDGTPTRTVFESPNSLSFFVPAVDTSRNYKVEIAGDKGTSTVGTFRVDPTSLTVSPTELSLTRGQPQALTFTLPNPAPTGGLLLDVTTDIPESVIMPEVVVPEGATSITVNVTGGKAGTGSLVLKGYGAGEVSIPVTVK